MCQIDWSITAAIIQALSGIIIALVAIFGLEAWKKEIIGKRKLEITEQCLTAFFKAKDILNHARNGFSFPSEGEFETTVLDESLRSRAFSYNTPAERLIKEADFFHNQKSLEYKFKTINANVADEWFESIFKAQREVIAGSQALVRQTILGQVDMDDDFRKRMEVRISVAYVTRYNQPDPYKKAIDNSILEMENFFKIAMK